MTHPNSPGAEPVGRLIDEFDKLPGIGPKMAQRLAYHLVRMPEESARSLADALVAVKERIVLCSICYNITEQDPCRICSDPARDQSRICVVEEALDVMALERTGRVQGTVPRPARGDLAYERRVPRRPEDRAAPVPAA